MADTAPAISLNAGSDTIENANGNGVGQNYANADQASTAFKNMTTPPSSPALIATSGQSRSNYADNVNTMNTAIGNNTTTFNPNGSPTVTQGQYGKVADFGGGAKAFTDPRDNPDYVDPSKTQTNTTKQNGDGTSTPNADGTTTTKNADGSSTDTGDGLTATTSDGIKTTPDLAKAYEATQQTLNDQVSRAKSNLSQALSTLQNDPAAASAVNMILQKYDQQISLMQAKNKVVLGSYAVNAARSGGMQYANDMTTSFLSEEQDKASQRITDLISQETSMVLKAQAAYKKGDVSAFDQASKALDSATKAKNDQINKLLTATNNAVKTAQAAQKQQINQQKQQTTDNIRTSTAIAQSAADAISSSGITDPKKIKTYIDGLAKAHGITDPTMLESAVSKAQATSKKFSLQNENTQSEINARNNKPAGGSKTPKGGKDGAFSYTPADITTYTNLMNTGGKDPSGQVYNGRGTDGFVDPGTYLASYNDWVKNGGTPQGFVKQFPVTNVNPADYATLPKALQPAAKASKTSNPPA